MKKIGLDQVTKITGVGSSSVRLYIADGLITPQAEAEKHLKDNCFTEVEIEQIKAISTLRKWLGASEIQYIRAYPERTEDFIQDMSEKYGLPLNENESFMHALRFLQECPLEEKERVIMRKKTKKHNYPLWVRLMPGIMIVLYIIIQVHIMDWAAPNAWCYVSLFVSGVLALLAALLAYRSRSMINKQHAAEFHGVGQVVRVKKDAGFGIGYARAGNSGSSFSEQGKGGIWVFLFAIWYELRPDNWYPVILYTNEANERLLSSFRYGGWRNDWNGGQMIPIAWDSDHKVLYPVECDWLKRKSNFFFFVAALLTALCLILVIYVNI